MQIKSLILGMALAAVLLMSASVAMGTFTHNGDYGIPNPYASIDWLDCVNTYVTSNYTMEPVEDWATVESTGDALIAACGQPNPDWAWR